MCHNNIKNFFFLYYAKVCVQHCALTVCVCMGWGVRECVRVCVRTWSMNDYKLSKYTLIERYRALCLIPPHLTL